MYQEWFDKIIKEQKLQKPEFLTTLAEIIEQKNKCCPNKRLPLHINDFVDYIINEDKIMQLLYVLFVMVPEQTTLNNDKLNTYKNKVNRDGWTILHLYARFANNSDILILQEILKRPLNINIQEPAGWTALMIACRHSNIDSSVETVKILLDAKCDVNLKNKDEWTALMIACRYSNTDSSLETVKILLDANCDINLQNKDEWTALMMACHYSNTDSSLETVKILLNANCDVNLQNNEDLTALMIAVKYANTTSNLETVKLLNDARIKLIKKY